LVLVTVAEDTAYHLRMSRLYAECLNSDSRDHWVAGDVLLRQQSEEEEDEEADDGNRKEEGDNDDEEENDDGYSE
jgi:hypothetical protein